MSGFSIEDIIDSNTNKNSIKPIPPDEEYYKNFILLKPFVYKEDNKPKKMIIIFTGPTSSRDRVQNISDYFLIKTYDNGNIEIYSIKSDEDSFKKNECEILKQIGYESESKSESCVIAGGKRKRRKTKKNKKRKSKKSKRRRRRIS